MLIGEICRLSGLSKDTVRFYEKMGLIQVPRKDLRYNNYKEYSPEILRKLLVIKRLKDFGFTLNEIAEYLSLIDHQQASCNNVSEKMEEKVKILDEKIEELKHIRSLLVQGVESCLRCQPDPSGNCAILVSELLPD